MKILKILKRINISYTARLLLFFIIAGLLFGVISLWYQLSKVNNQNQQDITAIREALEELEGYAKTEELDEDGKPYIHIDIEQPAIDIKDTTDLGDILSIVQNQNAQTSRDLSSQITLFSIIISVVVLVIPILNYTFLQKDQIKKLNKQHKKLKDQLTFQENRFEVFEDQFKNELDRLSNSVELSSQVTEAMANPKDKSPDIKPISGSNKDKASAHYIQAGVSLSKKEDSKALSFINKAIELEPDNAKYYNRRGDVLEDLECYEEALKDITKAIEIEPKDAYYYWSRERVLKNLERYEEALIDINKAIELEPKDAYYYWSRANVLEDLERYEEALKDITKAIEIEPKDELYYWSRANVLEDLERYEEALKDITKAIEIEPKDAFYYWSRGNVLEDLERYEEALKDINKAIELEPDNDKHHKDRERLLKIMNRDEKA